jgi:DNA-binding transcriptional ArsR family regulator
MKKPNKITINETLNELLLQVFTGIDYVTKIALKTNKSIPVVYRQLDILVGLGILSKQRSGKTVAYSVDWINLSDIITSSLFMDIERIRKITKASEKEAAILKELHLLIAEVPKELFTDKKTLSKVVKEFFSHKEVIALVQGFFRELTSTENDHIDFKKLSFEETVNLFIDTFGMLTKEQQNRIISKKLNIKNENVTYFMRYCRIKYLQRKLSDPRNKFLDAMTMD